MRGVSRQVVDRYWTLITQPIAWIICAGVTLIAAAADIYGLMPTLGFGRRLVVWGAVVAVGLVIGLFLRAILQVRWPLLSGTREDMLVALALAVIYVPILDLVHVWAVNAPLSTRVDLISAGMVVFGVAVITSNIRRVVDEHKAQATTRDRLFNRLDASDRARIDRISSADHHVVVYLSDGTEHKLRLRLRDAVEEVDVEPGFCVHRSHWVALRVIASASNGGPKAEVHLANGVTLPVGPKYRQNLVDAGFLSD